MNIRQNTNTNRPLLTIDDPTIYQGDYSPFLNVATASEIASCTEENVLYLVTSGSGQIPYVKTPTGVEILPNPFSRGPTLPYPDANNIYQLNDNLVAIDNHLYALRKELSYWNLYQISYSVDKADDFSATLASIGPGEALIINIDGEFKYEGQSYSRGDIILRLTDGTYTTIKASAAGFYYPSKVVQDGKNYTLYYNYWQENTVESDPATIPIASETASGLTKPHMVEYFQVEVASARDSFMYGQRIDMSIASVCSFEAASNPYIDQPIPPIVKFFTEDGEEVALDFTCVCTEVGTQKVYNLAITENSKPTILKYAYIK